MIINKEIANKIKGIFFGQAIGDALGLGAESMTTERMNLHYPKDLKDYTDFIADKHRLRWQQGDWTDDTNQFLCILRSLLKHQKVDLNDIAAEFKNWMYNDGMGTGATTYKVFSMPQYELYPQRAAELVWKLSHKRIAPNGGLMRNAIVCTYHYWDINAVLQNTEAVCQLSHFDPRCVDSCKVMALIITGELNQKPISWENLKSEIDKYDSRVSEKINTITCTIDELDLANPKDWGYTLKSLSAGVWSYYNAPDFRKGLLAIINQGGDADTNGCIVGSILGAKFGFDAIPTYLIEGLRQKEVLLEYYNSFMELIKL